jgi:hypothetical protein
MQDYEHAKCNPGTVCTEVFAKKLGITKRREKRDSSRTLEAVDSPSEDLERRLTNYCESMLEEHEDEVSEQIRGGKYPGSITEQISNL